MTIALAFNSLACAAATFGWLYIINVFFDAINTHWLTRLAAWLLVAFWVFCFLVNFTSLFASLANIVMPYIIPSRIGLQALIAIVFVMIFFFVHSKRDVFKTWSQQFKKKKLSAQ